MEQALQHFFIAIFYPFKIFWLAFFLSYTYFKTILAKWRMVEEQEFDHYHLTRAGPLLGVKRAGRGECLNPPLTRLRGIVAIRGKRLSKERQKA